MDSEKTILVIGAGLLGENLLKYLGEDYDTRYTWFTRNPRRSGKHLDITDEAEVRSVLESLSPDSAILTAAYTDVDGCESNPGKAFEVNSEAPAHIAEVCKDLGSHLVYVSTDYVFDGRKGDYSEDAETKPLSVYGESKLRGEQNVLSTHPESAVARTSVIWGWERPNFATWVLNALKNGEEVNVIDDQLITPTLNYDLSRQLQSIVENGETGIFHTAGGSKVNHHEFATALAQRFGLDTSPVRRSKMEEMNWQAERPRDSSLDTTKIEKLCKPMDLQESVKHFHQTKPEEYR